MSKILYNNSLTETVYEIAVEGSFEGGMGQFYMVRAWDEYPVLSRPLSIHDLEDDRIVFLYRICGEGTRILSKKKPGDEISIDGPYGNGFPMETGRIALVGGGLGTAPLRLAAKTIRELSPEKLDIYLGYSDEDINSDRFSAYADSMQIDIGGFVTEGIDPSWYDVIFACGPEPMMEALAKKTRPYDVKVFVSMEKRMACGIGACLVCTCKTKNGNKKTCKDGPVFAGEDVFFDEL
ncbi:MAG: dihydroorotate dehydrogenase electron transfer subunit [Peptostreptococcaceae bacterium]|nr:dihydroorotate dehydrogenase electron transfer subunit [Peptostreptococcaceae bacterium]